MSAPDFDKWLVWTVKKQDAGADRATSTHWESRGERRPPVFGNGSQQTTLNVQPKYSTMSVYGLPYEVHLAVPSINKGARVLDLPDLMGITELLTILPEARSKTGKARRIEGNDGKPFQLPSISVSNPSSPTCSMVAPSASVKSLESCSPTFTK